jgi:predicted transcriptional regulator
MLAKDSPSPTNCSQSAPQPTRQLIDAIQIGLADAEAGRFVEFSSGEELSSYLKALTAKAIERR